MTAQELTIRLLHDLRGEASEDSIPALMVVAAKIAAATIPSENGELALASMSTLLATALREEIELRHRQRN